jgi:alcohol dehydrogenase class IV
MSVFSCNLPGEIIVGEGKIEEIADYIKQYGNNCFIVIDPFFTKTGLSDEIVSLLKKDGIESTVFSKVKPNPDCREVDEGAGLCRKHGCDIVLAVGGGSAVDSGKAIAVVAKNGGKSWDYVYKSERAPKQIDEVLPVVALPTTAGTGTEATHFSVLSNPEVHEKGTIVDKKIFPCFAVVDPSIMKSMPPRLTALTGIDALSHCVEAYVANIGSPFSSMVAREGIKIITRSLPEAYANGDNMKARKDMAWGSVLGGIAIGHASVGLPHALGQPIGGIVNAPHGASVAACLAEVVEYSFMSSFELFAGLAVCFDESVKGLPLYDRAEKSVELINRFFKYVDCTERFSDYGMKESDIDKATEVVFGGYGDNVRNFPRVATPEDVKMLYKKCL